MSDTALQKANGTAAAARADEADPRAVTVTPRVDILETDDEYLILADMPGVLSGDVDVRFENGELTVHGRRNPSHGERSRATWEYEVASYYRSFRVTDQIAADRIEAELTAGVLTLRLPKVEAIKPRRIAVKG